MVCDEPVSALDVSIQAQVINLLKDLQGRLGLSYLFIAHDLAVVKHIADRIAVMYLGKIVEVASKEALFANPRHPYTRTLLVAIPRPDPRRRGGRQLPGGDVPSPMDPPPGCRFNTRCSFATDKCRVEEPPLRADRGRPPVGLPLRRVAAAGLRVRRGPRAGGSGAPADGAVRRAPRADCRHRRVGERRQSALLPAVSAAARYWAGPGFNHFLTARISLRERVYT